MKFQATTAGMAVASTAGSSGPQIAFATFKLGSAFGYTPTAADTGLNGTTVFSGNILSATPYDASTMDVVIQIPGNVASFNFGEIGLYLNDANQTMFCKAVYVTAQSKIYDPTNGVGGQFTIHCLIKLADAMANFTFTFNNVTSVPIIPGASIVGPDSTGASVNAAIALDYTPTIGGGFYTDNPILLARHTTTQWNIIGYSVRGTFTPTSVTGSPVSGGIAAIFTQAQGASSTLNKSYIIQGPGGQIVVVDGINTATGAFTLTRNVSWLNSTNSFTLYLCDALTWNSRVAKSGDTMTGPLNVQAALTANSVNGQTGSVLYINSVSGQSTNFVVGSTPVATLSESVATFLRASLTTPIAIVYSSSTVANAQQSNTFMVGTLTGNTSFSISNPTEMQLLLIRFTQDSTGGRTVTLPTAWKVTGNLGANANQVSYLSLTYNASKTRFEGTWTATPA